MKRILSVVLVLVLLLSFAGCKQDKGRELYNLNLEKYVTLGEYKGVKVDTKSDDFKKLEDIIISNDIANNNFYKVITKGKVENGYTLNIDYEGKKDGVAFEGGTAKGQSLTIGSGQFIDGFEDGLIGKEIGSTVELDLTFPEDYGNDLAGADVVFTVKINSARTTTALDPEVYYNELGYKTVEEYYENVKERATEETIIEAVTKAATTKDYPETDLEAIYKYYYDTTAANVKSQYGVSMADYFAAIGQTEADFKEAVIKDQIKPLMDQQMVWYAILDTEEIAFGDEDIEAKIKEIIATNGDTSITRADVIEQLGKIYIENVVVSEKVLDFLKENAVIS